MVIKVPAGYKVEFMPSDHEILLIGLDVVENAKSIYRDKIMILDMYNISFIEKLAKALPAIEIENKHLVITGRKPNPQRNGFMRDLTGYHGAYWHEGGEPVKIDELGYFREMSLILGGEGDKGSANAVWSMKEYFTSSVIEIDKVICTVYLADDSVKKALNELHAGLAVAEIIKERATAPREITVPLKSIKTGGDRGKSVLNEPDQLYIGTKGSGRNGNGIWICERSESMGITTEAQARVNAGGKGKGMLIEEKGKRVLRNNESEKKRVPKGGGQRAPIVKPSDERVGSSNQTQELDYVDSVLGSVYCTICDPVVEGAGEGVQLTSSEKNDMTTTEYYNQDEKYLKPRKQMKD